MQRRIGDVLHVDLTRRTWRREPIRPDELVKYLGGRGLGARRLWEMVRPGTDPLGPDNVIIFGPGLLTGTGAPSSGRTTVTCLSPATGLYLKTNGGGDFGYGLKSAGLEQLIVSGQADRPVYLWIDGDGVEFRDAQHLWGKDIRTAAADLRRELDDADVQTAMIGPAGERRVRFAAVMFSIYNAAGRGGAGAVMGAKNLKAIAVRGRSAYAPAQPGPFLELAGQGRAALLADSGAQGLARYGTSGSLDGVNELRVLPAYNYRHSSVDDVYPLTGQALVAEGYLKRRVACYSCVIGCHRYATVEKGPFAGAFSGGPEYETMSALGSGCGVSDTAAVIRANELCDIYGLDTISTGSAIQWAMECFERGVISRHDLDGMDLRWGDGAAVVDWVRRIAFREGFGDILAEGVKRAAEQVGGDSWKWAVEAKGLEQSRVDTRSAKSYALAFAVNPRGPDHLHTETFAEFGLSPEAKAVIKQITGDEKYAVPYLTDKRAEIVRWHEDVYAATDALGFCAFTTTAAYGISPELMAGLFSAATGYSCTVHDLMQAGRRIVTLEKCFNVGFGATRQDDTLPWRLMNEASPERPGAINTRAELDGMLDEYYRMHGWDPRTSWPTGTVLAHLGLEDVAGELAAAGRLGAED